MKTIWLKIKKIRPELIFFYLFVISLPWQERHIFNLEQAQIDGHFLEWEAISLYLSDIFLGLCLLAWAIRGLNSLIKRVEASKKQQKEQVSPRSEKRDLWLFFMVLGAFFLVASVSLVNTYEIDNLGLYKLIKLVELFLLFFFVVTNIVSFRVKLFTLALFVATGFSQAILGIWQYLKQGSVGFWAFGEHVLSPDKINVAKIVVDGEKVLRAYGTFPHANALAGFLVIALIFLIVIIVIHLPDFSLIKPGISAKIDVIKEKFLDLRSHNIWLYVVSLVFCLMYFGLIVTFSRTAWFGLIFALALVILLKSGRVLRGINNLIKNKINFRNALPFILILIFVIILPIIFWPQLSTRATLTDQHGDLAVSNRVFYNDLAIEMIEKVPLFGVGLGNFVLRMNEFVNFDLKWWQYQPVHNMYLLITSEMGILGVICFGLFLFLILRKAYLNYKKGDARGRIIILGLFASLVAIFVISFFDHYFWDIQQDVMSFWLVLGLLYSSE